MTDDRPTGPVSGDYCRFLRNAKVEHYRCDEYRDGTITSVITGEVVKPAHWGAPIGFYRTDAH